MLRLPSRGGAWLIVAILSLWILSLYGQVGNHSFNTFDDPGYITENPVVKDGLTASGIAWAFTTT